MPEPVEFHFREFFRDDAVRILVNGEEAAAFSATTRPQIGLAHVEPLAVGEGDRVTVCVAGAGERTVTITKAVRYWTVDLVGGELSVNAGQDEPGYL